MKIKTILVSQPKPEGDKSPYFDLGDKHKLKIDFRPFIHVEGISTKEFRQSKINILDFTAVIFTSRNAVDHFFRICEDMRILVPSTMKYFCISESTAFYLQKYVVYRKRKIFYGKSTFKDLIDIIKKHKENSFLMPCSVIHKQEYQDMLQAIEINYTNTILYKTVASDLSDLADLKYDMLVFFSPSGVKSLFKNFPDFEQKHTCIATFGATTAKAATDSGLKLDVEAPMPKAPSMTMALDQFVIKMNKK